MNQLTLNDFVKIIDIENLSTETYNSQTIHSHRQQIANASTIAFTITASTITLTKNYYNDDEIINEILQLLIQEHTKDENIKTFYELGVTYDERDMNNHKIFSKLHFLKNYIESKSMQTINVIILPAKFKYLNILSLGNMFWSEYLTDKIILLNSDSNGLYSNIKLIYNKQAAKYNINIMNYDNYIVADTRTKQQIRKEKIKNII